MSDILELLLIPCTISAILEVHDFKQREVLCIQKLNEAAYIQVSFNDTAKRTKLYYLRKTNTALQGKSCDPTRKMTDRYAQASKDDDSMTSSLTGPPSDDLSQFKSQTEYQILILQRLLQEMRNTLRVLKEQMESIGKENETFKGQLNTTETRLAQLQKIVASQADNSAKLKKEVTDKDTALKTITEELKKSFDEMKATMETLTAEVDRNRSSASSSSASPAVPENLLQMFEALERQLGIYDVRLAEMDLRFQVLETTSYHGCLVWRIRDFQRRKEDAKRGRTLSLYSQPFYTSRYGYKMCARIYLNGDGMGKGSHISLFFVLMKGEYDAMLTWPFRQKVTLILLDQGPAKRNLSDTFRPDPSSSSFMRPNSDMNIASGCPLFVSQNAVEGSDYVKDDTIFIRVVVDTSDLESF